MYILQYIEETNGFCKKEVGNFSSFTAAFDEMLARCEEITHKRCKNPQSRVYESSAFIRDGINQYSFMICEDEQFIPIKNQLFILSGSSINAQTGDLCPIQAEIYSDINGAKQRLADIYMAKLEELKLENNDACNEAGKSIPGGYIDDCEAVIYNEAPYANNCLLEAAAYVITITTLTKGQGYKDE